jgi:hypothetical protein
MSSMSIYDPDKEKILVQNRLTWRQAIENAKDAKEILDITKQFYPNAVRTMLTLNVSVYYCMDNERMVRLFKAADALLEEELSASPS